MLNLEKLLKWDYIQIKFKIDHEHTKIIYYFILKPLYIRESFSDLFTGKCNVRRFDTLFCMVVATINYPNNVNGTSYYLSTDDDLIRCKSDIKRLKKEQVFLEVL
jgi:hypothetical protein